MTKENCYSKAVDFLLNKYNNKKLLVIFDAKKKLAALRGAYG